METSLLLVKEKTHLQEKATRAANTLLTVWVISLYLIYPFNSQIQPVSHLPPSIIFLLREHTKMRWNLLREHIKTRWNTNFM